MKSEDFTLWRCGWTSKLSHITAYQAAKLVQIIVHSDPDGPDQLRRLGDHGRTRTKQDGGGHIDFMITIV